MRRKNQKCNDRNEQQGKMHGTKNILISLDIGSQVEEVSDGDKNNEERIAKREKI